MSDVLSVRGLSVSVRDTALVSGVDLTVGAGERVGLIGESGSGKSLTALSILGLLPEDVRADGSVRLDGVDHELVGADERRMSRVRGRDIAMVFQEPMTALNPTMRIGDQLTEAMLIHKTLAKPAARAAAADLLDRVQLPSAYACAAVGDAVVAVGRAVVDDGWVGVFGMATRPAARRTGAARSVLASLAQWAEDLGAARMYLQVERDNFPALRLYERAGFRVMCGFHYRAAA